MDNNDKAKLLKGKDQIEKEVFKYVLDNPELLLRINPIAKVYINGNHERDVDMMHAQYALFDSMLKNNLDAISLNH